MGLLNWFVLGGAIMWPIALLLVLALAIVVDRILVLFWTRTRGGAGTLKRALAENGPEAVAGRADRSLLGRVAQEWGRVRHLDHESRTRTLRHSAGQFVEILERRLGALPTITAMAPLLGLLGTIFGMMEAFRAIERSGSTADIGALAGGLWPALLTTAFGLIVALITFALHALCAAAVQKRTRDMEAVVELLEERERLRVT